MRRGILLGTSLTAASALIFAACGSGTTPTGSTSGPSAQGGTATVNMGTAPDSLDPQSGYTTQAAEADWLAYTGLLTYAHANGQAGTQLIPGLAQSLPQISSDGLTYTMTLRPGLTYSNGQPVKASDFPYSLQRAMKISWGGKSFITDYVAGASDYDSGKAPSISGITADDATGQITIHLTKAYGAFANVLAFPAAGLVPSGTPMNDLGNNPPPGVGSYTITNVVPNQSFTMQKNDRFNIPGIPQGHLQTVKVNITSNTLSEAQQVLNNQADNFDAGDTVPPALLSQIQSTAGDRFAKETAALTFYFFMNTTIPPFNNPMARQAVNLAIDRRALQRLASGFLTPGCYFLPPGLPGHPTASCPYGDPNGAPDLSKAQAMIKQAGLDGTPVTVYGETRSPRRQYVDYYTNVLNQLGFHATEQILQDSVYFTTIGNASTNPQTGFADWSQDFPNPSDFYLLLDGTAIQPVKNQNFSKVNDPQIQAALAKLYPVPATQLSTVASQWQELDQYTAKQAYEAVYGYEQVPKFMSNRINFGTAIFHPVYYNDWSSWQLK
ncbi:MAG TPA: ABC transporter substrate-binding protein [Acidimicrobiales bacterium]|nr:ABC transporter substrate-binding protein [Acidimicrobiales bacterium]